MSGRNFNSECGQVFTKKQFIIESPLYPTSYPLNYECSYLIKGPTCPTYFNLQLLDFSLEDSLGCSKDRLEVEDKDAICGSKSGMRQYFSEKGTLILRFVSDKSGTGRGYRILVTRSPCGSGDPETTTLYGIPQWHKDADNPETTSYSVPKWHTTNRDVEYTTTTKPSVVNRRTSKCCPNSYGSKKFILTSPNFPYSMSTPTDCIYEIYRANRNVCRLRIDVDFFWLGHNGNNCAEGFLEIDGRFICGCKSNLKLVSSFEGSPTKILRFVSKGYERSSYSGFVLEIIQDECPKKYTPEEATKNRTFEEKFRFYNDQINRVAWPSLSHGAIIDKLHLISENTEVLSDQVDDWNKEKRPKVVRHVYFFAEPGVRGVPKDREDTDYVDTSSMNSSFLQDSYDYNYCLNWNRQQLNSVTSRYLPVCKINEATLDLQNKHYEDMNFVTDAFYCGKGFYGVYEQIACQDVPHPINPTIPPTPPLPTPRVPCDRTIQEEMFTLDAYGYNGPTCTFIVKKHIPYVCSISLYFEKFDLACASESLIIDGTMYCGRLTGQSVVPLESQKIELKIQDVDKTEEIEFEEVDCEEMPSL
ncbi:uncharacterized protein BDFB_009569 [Asbolus verrucosus]|uniref:CUB domain-containing protein n=1 Tax=Asbolus verrucosus TaxID=1661398 RepID=A0A482WCX3_ASBVE|nr:uncharacterized protein BDFB_009569 [Asbolus verrucosus]